MEMKKLGAAALGTMLAATGVSSFASTAAVAAQSPLVSKTSNVESTTIGDVVTFTVTVTGSPNQMVSVYDTITGYLDNASAPAITSITSEGDATGVMTDIWGDDIVAFATLGPSGEFSFTYSILVESLGDAVLQSEVCVEPMFTTTTRRPDPGIRIEPQEAAEAIDALQALEQGALVEEALEAEDETPVLASEVAVLNSVEGCMTHEVSIVVPEEPEPEQPEPEQPEPEQPEPGQPEPEQPEPEQPEPEQPEPEQPQPALAETGGANTTGMLAASAAALAGLGGSLIAFRRKFMQQKP